MKTKLKIGKKVKLKKEYCKWELENLCDLHKVGDVILEKHFHNMTMAMLVISGLYKTTGKITGYGAVKDTYHVTFKNSKGVYSHYFDREDLIIK